MLFLSKICDIDGNFFMLTTNETPRNDKCELSLEIKESLCFLLHRFANMSQKYSKIKIA